MWFFLWGQRWILNQEGSQLWACTSPVLLLLGFLAFYDVKSLATPITSTTWHDLASEASELSYLICARYLICMNLGCALFITDIFRFGRPWIVKVAWGSMITKYMVTILWVQILKKGSTKLLLQVIDENLKQIFQETANHIIYPF